MKSPYSLFLHFILSACLLEATTLNAQNIEWARSFGGNDEDIGHAISLDALGNVYTTGYFHRTVDFDPGVGITHLTPVGYRDIFVQKLDASGNFLWARSFGGGYYDEGLAISVDAWGNVYTTGYFHGTVDFDPGAGVTELTSIGRYDIFVQKLDASGNFLWARSFGSDDDDLGRAISVDTYGNVYITGRFKGTIDFDPGVGITELTSTGIEDIFMLKLDASGNLLWARSYGGNSYDESRAISVDASGNVYTIGIFSGAVDFDPGVGTTYLAAARFSDIFVQKLDASGNFLWVNAFRGASSNHGHAIGVDASGNVYTTGYFSGTITFFSGIETTSLTSTGERDIFVQKLDPSGSFLWARSFGGDGFDEGGAISVDALGNVYTTGHFSGTVDFDPGAGTTQLTSAGSRDIFVQKLDTWGNFLWARSFGDYGNDRGNAISLDASGNLYNAGFFYGTVDFDPGAGTTQLTSTGSRDVFVLKLNPSIMNTAPVLANALSDQTATEGEAFSFTFPENTFSDADGDALIYMATLEDGSALPIWLVFDAVMRTFSGTPDGNDLGSINIKVTADDGNGGRAEDIFILTVKETPNTAPVLSNALSDQTAMESEAFSFTFPENTFSDTDGDVLTYIATLEDGSALPIWLVFDAATRTFSGTPTSKDVGSISIKVTTDDGNGGIAEDIFRLSVEEKPNTAPVLSNALSDQTAMESEAFSFTFPENTFSDTDGDALTYRATLEDGSALPIWLVFDASTRTFSGTPDGNDLGSLSIKVTTDDGNGGIAEDTFMLTVEAALHTQNFEWVRSFGGYGDDVGHALSVDASGNVYTIGYFSGTVDFDPGEGTAEFTSAGSWDIFVQKLDVSGNFLWIKSFGGTSIDEGHAISVDASGNVYTTGQFWGTVDFDAEAGTTELTSEGGSDIFVQKLDASGNFLWARSFGSNGSDVGYGISVDASGNVFITGGFQKTVDFDPGAGTAELTSVGSYDIFVLKLDASGNFLWARSFGGDDSDVGYAIGVDTSGNAYTTGFFRETVDFDPRAETANLTSEGGSDIFVQKLDASGNFLWARSFGSNGSDVGCGISIDASGYVHTTGFFKETVDFDPGAGTTELTSAGYNDIFIQKLDALGNFLWTRTFGGNLGDQGHAINVDGSGNVYSTGYFQETVDFDPGAGITELTSDGSTDIFVQKLDSSGNFLWIESLGGNGGSQGLGISVEASGNVYTTGRFNEIVGFNPGAGVTNLTSDGAQDIFVLKLSPGIMNTAPILANALSDQTSSVEGNFSFTFPENTFSDANGDALTYLATLEDGSALPSWLSFDIATRTLSGTPTSNDVGSIRIKVTADDVNGGTAEDFFILTVEETPNNAPELSNVLFDQDATDGEAFIFTFPENTFTDVNGDTLTYSATLEDGSALPSWLSFDATTHTFSGTPNAGDEGTVTVKVTASDGKGGTAEETFTITVGAPLSLEDEQLKQSTKLYPNHNQGRFFIELANDYTGRVTLQLMDITGKVHFEMVLMKNNSRIEYPVAQDNLAEGLYLLRIMTDEARTTKRLVIDY